MTAAMNASVNLSTYDGWVCEFSVDGENSFIIPPANPQLSPEDRDRHDLLGFYKTMHEKVLPLYYERPNDWYQLALRAMNDVHPFFDADRMADEYYKNIYA
jgi:starch phosphorylase